MYIKNKGMYIEELINNTSFYYQDNEIMYIEKRFLPIQPTRIENKNVNGILLRKSTVDYLCLYNGKYIDFEVKQTNEDYFDLKAIKSHQINHLIKINNLKGFSFLLIYYFKRDVIKVVDINQIKDLISNKKHKIYYNDDLFRTLDIIFPGIIDFKKYFEDIKIDS